MTWPINHLTTDDLDAFHSASLSVEAKVHLDECAECRSLALQDRAVLDALAALPRFAPTAGFADRVMARVRVEQPAQVPGAALFHRRVLATPLRIVLAAALLLSLGASIVWSLANRAVLMAWLNQSAAAVGGALWSGVRVVASNLNEQPWMAALRGFGSSAGNLALAGLVLLLIYCAALYALRRLLASPSRVVPHANR